MARVNIEASEEVVPRLKTVTITAKLDEPIGDRSITINVQKRDDPSSEWIFVTEGWPGSVTTDKNGEASFESPSLDNAHYRLSALYLPPEGGGEGGEGDEEGGDQTDIYAVGIRLVRSVKFTSDHGLLRDYSKDYEPGGDVFEAPEWEQTKFDGKLVIKNSPISHDGAAAVKSEVDYLVAPANTPSFQIELEVVGIDGFSATSRGSAKGGYNTLVTSGKDKLEEALGTFSTELLWSFSLDGDAIGSALTGPHTGYLTYGPPKKSNEAAHQVTEARMKRALAEVQSIDSTSTHEIVKSLVDKYPFDPEDGVPNAWTVPDLNRPVDCQGLVRYALKVVSMVGLKGKLEHRRIYATRSDPEDAIEVSSTHNGLYNITHPDHDDWQLGLVDHNGGHNNYEAVVKVTADGSTRYYAPSAGDYGSADEVLHVFKGLAWFKIDEDEIARVHRWIHRYE